MGRKATPVEEPGTITITAETAAQAGEWAERLRAEMEEVTTGPFGLALEEFECRVTSVTSPPVKSSGRPVGQETKLVLSLTARPANCGDMIREALFDYRNGMWERKEDIASVTFKKLDRDFNVRISRLGVGLLLEPKVLQLTDASALAGQMLGAEVHFAVEVHGLPRSYSSGFDAASDWYTPAYLVEFIPRPKQVKASAEDEGQTTLEDYVVNDPDDFDNPEDSE